MMNTAINMMKTSFTSFVLILLCISQLHAQTLLANNQVGEERLSPQEIKSIFLGTTSHWKNGLPISLCIDISNQEAFKYFVKHSLGKNVRSFKRVWSKRVFSGASSALPLLINDTERALKYVSEKQGAVCYIESAPSPLPKQTKQLSSQIDNKH